MCGLVCPSRASERGGEGDCGKEGEGEEGELESLLLQDLLQRVCVCVYYYSTYYKDVRVCVVCVYVFITAVPITKLFALGPVRNAVL